MQVAGGDKGDRADREDRLTGLTGPQLRPSIGSTNVKPTKPL